MGADCAGVEIHIVLAGGSRCPGWGIYLGCETRDTQVLDNLVYRTLESVHVWYYDRDILFYEESVEGTLSVGQDRDTRARAKYTFVNNSAVIGSTYDAVKVVKMVGHFPFFMGLECRDVLVIGFGIGVTTSAIAAHPEVESIECVELVAVGPQLSIGVAQAAADLGAGTQRHLLDRHQHPTAEPHRRGGDPRRLGLRARRV
mgnify:CR=1 FL=1